MSSDCMFFRKRLDFRQMRQNQPRLFDAELKREPIFRALPNDYHGIASVIAFQDFRRSEFGFIFSGQLLNGLVVSFLTEYDVSIFHGFSFRSDSWPLVSIRLPSFSRAKNC